jgi:hypothetical protein
MSHIKAEFVFDKDSVFEVDLPAQGKLSDSIVEFRKQAGAFLTTFLVSHNQSTEKVDIMEEPVDEDGVSHEGDGKQSQRKRKGNKRKR